MPIFQHGKNLAENSSFEKGEDGWTYNSAFTLVTENNIKYMKYEASSNIFGRLYRKVPTIAGHKYYCCSKIKLDNGLSSAEIFLSINPTANYPSPSKSFNKRALTEETLMPSVLQATDNNSYIGYMLQWNSSYNTGEVIGYIRDFICVDLTAIYGVGNEPTEQECVSLFPYEPYVEPKIKHIEAPTSGKNLFNAKSSSRTSIGYTVTVAGQEIKINGSGAGGLFLINDDSSSDVLCKLKSGKVYYFKIYAKSGSIAQGGSDLQLRSNATNIISNTFNRWLAGFSFTPENDIEINSLRAYNNASESYNNYTFVIQIEEGSTATTYEPYTNIDHFLPSDYQEVEYIESTGTQYIDTGIIPNPAKSYVFDATIQPVSMASSNNMPFGIGAGSSAELPDGYRFVPFGFRVLDSVNRYTFGYGTSDGGVGNSRFELGRTDHIISTLSANYRDLTVNGVSQLSETFTKTLPTYNRTLKFPAYEFNRGVLTNYIMKAKIFGMKTSEDGVATRNFIPCYRKSDNEVGLYDTVNNQFYTNQGTGSFIAGPNIVSDKIERAYQDNNLVFADRLPDELQECEYIQSSGTQYIDSGVNCLDGDIFSTKIKTQANSTDTYYMGFSGNSGCYLKYTSSGIGLEYTYINVDPTDINNIELTYDKTNPQRTTSVKIGAETVSVNSFSTNNNFSIFKITGSDLAFSGKLFECKITKNNLLSRNFIPCYIKPNHTFVDVNGTTQSAGTIGLYDKVNGELYVNAGTGTFTKGRDI